MLKLLDRNLSSTKRGHNYWKYDAYWENHENPYYWFKQDSKWDDLFHTIKLEDCPVLKTRSDFNNGISKI